MPFPAAIVPVTVTGKIVSGSDGSTPAVGTVTFTMPGPLYDTADNVLLSAVTYTATLDGTGSFTISLPPTNSPNVNPSNWSYSVRILTSPHSEYGAIQVPYNGGTVNFNSAYTPGLAAVSGNTFVPASGGTMTGDLILSGSDTDLTVGGTASVVFSGETLNIGRLLAIGLSTSIVSGGDMSPNADPTKIDISALTGYIVTYNSTAALSSTNPDVQFLSVSAQVGLTPATNPSFFLVNSAGTYIQQATTPTPTQRRTHLFVGFTAQDLVGNIIVDQTLPVTPSQLNNQLIDLMSSLGPFSTSGNVISANGANLTFNKTSGRLFARAFSQVPTPLDPHTASIAAQTPVQFRHVTALIGSFSALGTTLDVGNYDPNGAGVITAITGGANQSSNFRVIAFANNTVTEQILVQYGQVTYASLDAAAAGVGAETFTPNPAFDGGALIGWISATRTATNLSDTSQARFLRSGKFPTP